MGPLLDAELWPGTPAGNLGAGWLADIANPRWAVSSSGLGVAVGLLFLGSRVRDPRPVEAGAGTQDVDQAAVGLGEIIDDEAVADEATMIGN